MAVEYSEIMAAAAMFYSNRELDAYTQDADSLLDWLKDAYKTVSNQAHSGAEAGTYWSDQEMDEYTKGGSLPTGKKINLKNKWSGMRVAPNIVYGANETQFKDYVDKGRWDRYKKLSPEKQKEYLTNAVQGISAAKAIKKWLHDKHGQRVDIKAETVFITGNKWPNEVEKFQIKAFGFDDYNSSDIIIKTKGLNYFGISLKKKPKENSADPTLINKAFDSILDGPGPNGTFTNIKLRIQEARAEYFAGVVREAAKKDILSIPAAHLNWDDQTLFAAKNRDKTKFERAYIDTKGNNSDGYNTDPKNCKALAMKDFVNGGLKEKENPLWKKFMDVVEDHGKLFADTLINLVLKVKLYEKLAANKDLEDYRFGFALVTGTGNLTMVKGSNPAKYDPHVRTGKAFDLHTVLEGLQELTAAGEDYKMDVDFDKKEITDAAKIFFTISKKKVPILDIELRYKGSFTPQPQFFANITPEFKTIMTKKCLVKP